MEKELQVAIKAAKESGKILKKYFGKSMKSYLKKEDTLDYVTEADLKIQAKIIQIIKKNFPEHGILAEENINEKAKYRWIIDPIDGTTNFIHNLTLFGICLALEQNGEIVLGVIYNPVENNLYYASKGHGAYKNGKKISVSKNKNFNNALLVFTLDKKIKPRQRVIDFVKNISNDFKSILCFQSSAIGFALLAEGKIDASFDFGAYWDFAAGKIIVEEAGGKITDWKGDVYRENSGYILASNNNLHQIILKKLIEFKK